MLLYKSQGMALPSYKDMIGLQFPTSVEISPQGDGIIYTVQETNWKDNSYIQSLFVYDSSTDTTSRLTRTLSSTQVQWIDEDSLLVLATNPSGSDEVKKPQLYYYESLIGEPLRLTDHKTGIQRFKYKEDRVFFIAKDPDKSEQKEREEKFGDMVHQEEEQSADTVYYADLKSLVEFAVSSTIQLEADQPKKPILDLHPYLKFRRKITDLFISNGNTILVNTRDKEDLYFLNTNIMYKLDLDFDQALNHSLEDLEDEESSDNGDTNPIDHQIITYDFPPHSTIAEISPDGSKILISYSEDGPEFYTQNDLYHSSIDDLDMTNWVKLTSDLDREIFTVKWTASGIYVCYPDFSKGRIGKYSEDGIFEQIRTDPWFSFVSFSVSNNGVVVFPGANATAPMEVIRISQQGLKVLTNFSSQVESWRLGKVETIEWKSRDDTTIEGVIHYPPDFDKNKKYPLVFVVHGGPTWLNFSYLFEYTDLHYYPVLKFINDGIIVVKPNYRGSIGRGSEFKRLNKGNIGEGDQWDLESCIGYLDNKGFIDTDKIGCMGWSQGGYISAYMGTHSEKIRAVSMGAGISSWYTYWMTNDIRQWSEHYLLGSPRQSPGQYEKTAPITRVDETSTPFLIQHGEKDQRVPLANALEMHRRLKDVGTQAELFIFKDMPHGITKPREHRAILHQNYTWFTHHLLGDELDFFDDDLGTASE